MSTDLHDALRAAVADAPFDEPDLGVVVKAGSRRVRRRAALAVGASALAVAAVVTSAAVISSGSDQDVRPADVVHLELSDAERLDPDILASVRTTMREPMTFDDEARFEAVSPDGLVLRSRYTEDSGHAFGLLDPGTGRTDWLPSAPASASPFAAEAVVELTSDRLVLLARPQFRLGRLMTFDRRSETWQSVDLRLPRGLEAHVPPKWALASDGRLYLGSTFEGESGPMRWWSFSSTEGGEGRSEPDLTGAGVAWGRGGQARADSGGRVVLSASGRDRVLTEQRPADCPPPDDRDVASFAPLVGLVGDRPVVTWWCDDEGRTVTRVYDPDGGSGVQVAGSLLATDEDHILITSTAGQPGGIYLLDLDRLSLARIASDGLHERQVDLGGGLMLWNTPGPIDAKDVYDVVWKVAAVPSGG